MPELPPVIPGEIITSDFTNDMARRTVQRYTDAADRTAKNPTPELGDMSFLDDNGDGIPAIFFWDATDWIPVIAQGTSTLMVSTRDNANMIRLQNTLMADTDPLSRVQLRTDATDGFYITLGSVDGSVPAATVMSLLTGGPQFKGATVMNVRFIREDVANQWRFNIQGGAGNLRLQSSPDGSTWNTVETWNPI